MANEEMQRAMDFIVEQAQSGAKIDALAEAQARNTEGIGSPLSIAEINEREINTPGHQVNSLSRDIATSAKLPEQPTVVSTPSSMLSNARSIERHNGKS